MLLFFFFSQCALFVELPGCLVFINDSLFFWSFSFFFSVSFKLLWWSRTSPRRKKWPHVESFVLYSTLIRYYGLVVFFCREKNFGFLQRRKKQQRSKVDGWMTLAHQQIAIIDFFFYIYIAILVVVVCIHEQRKRSGKVFLLIITTCVCGAVVQNYYYLYTTLVVVVWRPSISYWSSSLSWKLKTKRSTDSFIKLLLPSIK